MIRLLGKVPDKIYVATSGGPDSMAALDFLLRGRRSICALYFNHCTGHSDDAQVVVEKYCQDNNVDLKVGCISREKRKDESQEEYWRNERYDFFSRSVTTDNPIVTCHHLDDAVETWLFTSLHGNPMTIPYKRDNFIRPFLLSRKNDFLAWCDRKNVDYAVDPSNSDIRYMRNFIRHILLPDALSVNPGLHKVIAKKIRDNALNK